MNDFSGRTIVLGVGGGIAAYKVCELARLFVKGGGQVRVAMTPAATRFVGPLTFQALTGAPVLVDLLDPAEDRTYGHLALARAADLLVVAPATADLLARLRAGMADDAVTTTALACEGPYLLAPAMNTRMWQSQAVRENVRELSRRGWHVVGPAAGELADGDVGEGRLAEPAEIAAAAARLLGARDLVGRRVVVTAGPTREPLDPVRFISNPSTGKMGYAVARVAARRGAEVVLVSGPVDLPDPAGVRTVRVVTAEEMARAVDAVSGDLDVFVEFTFHPLNTYIGVPDYEVSLMMGGRTPALEIPPRTIQRIPRYGRRLEGLPLPYPVAPPVPRGSEPMLGGTVLAKFDLKGLDPNGVYDVAVKEAGKEMARARIDFRALR